MSDPMDPMAEIRASFFIECEELLEALQDGLNQLEDGGEDTETINVVFRAVHSIKGGAGAFGLEALVRFAHRYETVLDEVRSNRLVPDHEALKLFFQAADHLSDLVRACRDDQPLPEETSAALLDELDKLLGDQTEEEVQPQDFTPLGVSLDLPGLSDLDDAADGYATQLTSLLPTGPMDGIWDGLRDELGVFSDLRFACRAFADDTDFEVDLVFYDVHWYRELTAGPDELVCFNQDDGAGADSPPARADLVSGSVREAGNPWDRQGYLEGEDTCDDLEDFTVDFDDRGMDGDQNDGTDWGEDDGLPKCGRTNRGVHWFVFVR